MDRVLILYSNPSDTQRLRLDKEHRTIDQLLEKLKLPADTIERKHAVTREDLLGVLSEGKYDIIQFSGHGTGECFSLERENGISSENIAAEQVAHLLIEAQPNLKLAIFMTCFSAEALPILGQAAPYIITVFGPADDAKCVEFTRIFYDNYFRKDSIERAYFFAQEYTGSELQVVLTRRALDQKGGKVLFQVFPRGDHLGDSFLIDLEEAKHDIELLGVPREKFLNILTRKIRLHKKIFNTPRERAILPIGQFFGIFSWQNALDVIKCHRILRVRSDVDDKACEVWARLTVTYNDSAGERYRLLPQPFGPGINKIIGRALENFRFAYELISENTEYQEVLNRYVPEQYRLSKSIMLANMEMADRKLYQEDFGETMVYLESVLSALHDLLDRLTDELAMEA
ncbi:MAG: hypothetical protein WC600_10820 [Desulfobaccales bacterium]